LRYYSFTKPNKKPLFKEDTKLWVIFISFSLVLYIGFGVFLQIKSYLYKNDIQNYKERIDSLNKKIKDIDKKIDFIYIQKTIYEDILIKNDLVVEQIKNLLDLIPDPITLERFYIDHDKLIIYGITPTKDVYNLLMLPPLESIFEKTETYFYEMPNGWYRFKSLNYLKTGSK
jgi:cell division protein FtsL